ncbi:MAG: NYN domain-containing protein [Gemmatimonadales bacterium]|nr:NYN domain-containing protein [Gemmatimonadales bacterium]
MHSIPALRAGRTSSAQAPQAPNAALLIDFDNVTLGVRSDLTKELRHLLDSDIIKGKVSVQRAYADWRRYPQYIVPLSESSIDLIFAPAFGNSKKNATDIRLAVDAIELIFTRPEIGTFILLSGDSDFSSLVLKLKEYGKYVIGVGIRESASDILIQNCDEYFSYSDLAGLTRESDMPSTQRDPWELVVEAVAQMTKNGDVMRADRLKQVMQQIDQNFDEANAGFNRFSKFVAEAGARGLITVIKQENGQFDVAPACGGMSAATTAKPGAEAAAAAPRAEGSGRGRGRGRGRGGAREERVAAPSVEAKAAPVTAAVTSLVEAAPESAKDDKDDKERDRKRRRRGGRGRSRGGDDAAPSTETSARSVPEAPVGPAGMTLAEAFYLLSRALGELATPVAHEALRARMAALHGSEDPLLEPARFPRLLRQANDAEIADVRLLGEDDYEVSPHKSDLAMKVHAAPEPGANGEVLTPTRPAGALRFRSGTVTGRPASAVPMVGVVSLGGASKPAPEPAPAPAPKEEQAKVKTAAAAKPVKKAVKNAKAAKPKAAPVAKSTKVAPAKAAKGNKPVKNSNRVAQPKSAKVVKKPTTTAKAKKG